MSFRDLIVDKKGRLGIIQLNRPTVLNALNTEMMSELVKALDELDKDQTVNVIILTGGEKAFAAGADIREMSQATPVDLILDRRFELWDQIRKTAKPIIAAVSGFCLGGGNELAMNCDIIIASENA
ncbi:MAG TPA: enoyl-CoA hydratase-related protein, partial [Candidatus Bathyarchaeia archaeon]|nr:enoyl-CoA hydratase-related protein [Candidatus Bathyarchaeia archaeon]